jgi:pentapeptide MXKDX repeat protein
MTISTRIALGISAAALSLSLALVPAAFAQDPMSRDLEFRNSLFRYDGVKNPAKKDDGTKRYGTSSRSVLGEILPCTKIEGGAGGACIGN